MQGKIIRGIGGFYYVHTHQGVYECRARGIFRKDKEKPLPGDLVSISVLDETEKKGNLDEILPRTNSLIRPAVANVDQALVIFALVSPKPNFNLLDRFLVLMEKQNLPALICMNKTDLASDEMIAPVDIRCCLSARHKKKVLKRSGSIFGGRRRLLPVPAESENRL